MRVWLLPLLASCGVLVSRPPPPRLTSGTLAALERPEPAPPADDSTKLTLREAYRLALARSEVVGRAAREVLAADIDRRGVWTTMKPNVRAIISEMAQREVKIGTSIITPSRRTLAQASLDQPILRRDVGADLLAATRGVESADATYVRARQLLAREVAAAYIGVLRTRRLKELAKDAVERAKTQRQLAAGRVKAGQVLKNAELLADVDLARAQRLEVVAERDLAAAEVEFERLVGRGPPTLEMPPTPQLPDLPDALALAMKRPDVAALDLQGQQARAQRDAAARRRFWPRLDLHAQVQYFEPEVLQQSWNWQVVGTVTVPLFQSGAEFVELSARENDVATADLALAQQRKLVAAEVKVAALQLESAGRQVKFAEKQRDAARENYRLVDKQVRLGAITATDVTIAQSVLTEAESALEVATMERALATYDYLYAIGMLDLDGTLKKKQK